MFIFAAMNASLMFYPLKQVPTWPSVGGFADKLIKKKKILLLFYSINYWVKSRVKKNIWVTSK